MSTVTRGQIEQAIQGWIEPHLGRDLVAARAVREIGVDDAGAVTIDMVLGFPMSPGARQKLGAAIHERVSTVDGVSAVKVQVDCEVRTHGIHRSTDAVEGVKNIIAVASGKGGVGKSTCAVNLALALSAEGARVGILDADIYGPSQPRMLGISGKPESPDGKSLQPMTNYDVQSMSAGYLIDEETPMIWRGPMATQALEQLLRETNWDDLDYLVVDMPPGTGDIQLTLSQKVPVSGAVIVTTPQDIALLDARKGLKMFEKVNVPVLGVVENMSTHICSQCGHEEHIFGEGGGSRMAEQYGIELLGSLPLDIRIREQADGGKPTVVADPDGTLSSSYREIARNIAARLSLQSQDSPSRFPKIVVENT
ncbi:iron-sulfur cluster carrier protein ApbC [Methylonatrum kenyense]|uniref:iron-sulfur cluster carrier protein ApbC n=1 Tax=Methylonatrum kenyense TaxID=455253 RepID=UPI0020BFBFD5|nr:iron-sulfur cluster carrier protein ApbC [Methylonatrum kenyense]MCK8514822.1 iron-sulfur cluster carrier protein ApbC [Methylonatrum kenyense]